MADRQTKVQNNVPVCLKTVDNFRAFGCNTIETAIAATNKETWRSAINVCKRIHIHRLEGPGTKGMQDIQVGMGPSRKYRP